IRPFGKIGSSTQLFDAGRTALKELLLAATRKADVSQDKIVNLLAGPQQSAAEAQRMHELIANRIRSVLDGQRLVSLDTLMTLGEARGQLAPFLRDTLVGLNYAYYEPPGAQILHHNPLFVRSHDFAGESVIGLERLWQAPQLFGAGSPAGGGAHLVGSLADLPYIL